MLDSASYREVSHSRTSARQELSKLCLPVGIEELVGFIDDGVPKSKSDYHFVTVNEDAAYRTRFNERM